MIVFDRCLSPILGRSIRVRREAGRGEVGCARSESEQEEEPLDMKEDMEGREGMPLDSDPVMKTGSGKAAVAVDDDVVLCIWCRRVSKCLFLIV